MANCGITWSWEIHAVSSKVFPKEQKMSLSEETTRKSKSENESKHVDMI